MPVVNTTSPVTEAARADGVAVEARAVLQQYVGALMRRQRERPLPVGDAAGRDREPAPGRVSVRPAKQQFSARDS